MEKTPSVTTILTRRSSGGGELGIEVGEIAVLVDRGLALGDCLGQPDPVDDRGVVQLVADDEVVLGEQRAGHGLVGVPAAPEAERRRGTDQPSTGSLERAVDGEGPADEPHRRGAGAEAVERRPSRRQPRSGSLASPR